MPRRQSPSCHQRARKFAHGSCGDARVWGAEKRRRSGFRVAVSCAVRSLFVLTLALIASITVAAADEKGATTDSTSSPPASTPAVPAASSATAGTKTTEDQLYDLGQSLFDQYAPAEIKEQYDFPTKEHWNEFAAKLQAALAGDSIEGLAAYEPQARAALTGLRALPGY